MAAQELNSPAYPEGDALKGQIANRHLVGTVWRSIFLGATIVAIIALVALVYNVVDESFGLVAVQNDVEPEALVRAFFNDELLNSRNTFASENDDELAAALADDPYAIGFFGYAYYRENQDSLRTLRVNGIEPNAETAENGRYLLARPLFIYTAQNIVRQNPAVSLFTNYYLTYVSQEIESVGYFPASESSIAAARQSWIQADGIEVGLGQWPVINPAGAGGQINIVGSSTVYPITQRMVDKFEAAGFAGQINIQVVGTSAGLRALCIDGTADIANASRAIKPAEFEACRSIGRLPVEMRVGTDALAVVVSRANSFLNNVTDDQLREIFTTAETWAEVDPDWPNEPIKRYIPGADSGTLDFFTEVIFDEELSNLPKDTLVEILADSISLGLGRRLEREQRFYADRLVFESQEVWDEVCAGPEPPTGCTLGERSSYNVYELVLERVVNPDVKLTWTLTDSLLRRADIELEMQRQFPNAHLQFRAWLTPDFIVSPQSSTPEFAGVRTAILGTLWVVLITIAFSFPVGVSAAIYLEEYAQDNWLNRLFQTNINNLAGVPSIIYGMLGLAIFVRALEAFTSGAVFGQVEANTTANGRTILSAGLTLGLLILPIIIINAQEAIRAVPSSLRQASYGIGATKWQTVWYHVLPNALPGILTGTILALSRAIGETAPLVVVGASTFITIDPSGPFSKFTVLPIQIYQWTSRPQAEFRNIAAAAILVLLALLLTLNATAVLLRNKYSKQLT